MTNLKKSTAVVVALSAVILLSGCESNSPAPGNASNSNSTGAVATPNSSIAPSGRVEPPGTDSLPEHAKPAAPAKDAAKVAAAFARAWVRRDLPAEQWLAQITPLCTPGFGRQLATVDPGNLPADRVTGKPEAAHEPADQQAQYTVATNSGTLTVTLVDFQGRWQVSSNDFTASSR